MQGTYASFWSPALPTVEGPDSSGSLTSYLHPAPICLVVAEDGGRRENRAAYWDNNVVYIGDSCKPSATVLKPRRAMCELFASLFKSWVGVSASSSLMYGISCFRIRAPKCWFILICFGSEFCVLSYFCSCRDMACPPTRYQENIAFEFMATVRVKASEIKLHAYVPHIPFLFWHILRCMCFFGIIQN